MLSISAANKNTSRLQCIFMQMIVQCGAYYDIVCCMQDAIGSLCAWCHLHCQGKHLFWVHVLTTLAACRLLFLFCFYVYRAICTARQSTFKCILISLCYMQVAAGSLSAWWYLDCQAAYLFYVGILTTFDACRLLQGPCLHHAICPVRADTTVPFEDRKQKLLLWVAAIFLVSTGTFHRLAKPYTSCCTVHKTGSTCRCLLCWSSCKLCIALIAICVLYVLVLLVWVTVGMIDTT